jgi:hypothetical protein
MFRERFVFPRKHLATLYESAGWARTFTYEGRDALSSRLVKSVILTSAQNSIAKLIFCVTF